MARFGLVLFLALCLGLSLLPDTTTAQLSRNFYSNSCPNVEKIVKTVVQKKIQLTFVTVPATLRLFFHDCFPNGCDASVLIQSTPNNKAEKDLPDNLSLAGDGFDVVIQAKKALDAIPQCKNKVSCADILAIATRDCVVAAGGPFYEVELGRFDSLTSTASSIDGKLPKPTDKLATLLPLYTAKGLSLQDLIALSAAHTVGVAHCNKVFNRIYNFNGAKAIDPSLNVTYAKELQKACPKKVDPRIAIDMDPVTPTKLDNIYFKNLQQGKGFFTSDQDLFTDLRSRNIVNAWAKDTIAFNKAFVTAMTNLGRIGIKTSKNGNIRRDCGAFN